MLDLAIGGVSIAVLLGIVYWIHTSFVSEKTCKARQDCLEGKIDALHKLTKTEFRHLRELIEKFIVKYG